MALSQQDEDALARELERRDAGGETDPLQGKAFAFSDQELQLALHEIHDATGRLFTANWRSEELRMAKRIAGWARILEIGIEERQT